MPAANEDKRIRRTKKAIRDALLSLMEDKSVAEVTTTELCQKADINRSTFYAHYSSPEDVLTEIEQEFLGGMEAMLEENDGSTEVTVAMLRDIDAKRDQWRAIWHGDPDLITRALDLCCERTLDEWDKNGVTERGEGALFLRYITRGASGVVGGWLDDGCRLSPEELSDTINRFVFKGQQGIQS